MREDIYISPEVYDALMAIAAGITEGTKDILKALEDFDKPRLTPDGKEVHNPVPVALHTGLNRPHTLSEQIDRLVRVNLSRQMAAQGIETFEEANDFDVPEDDVIVSQYEVTEMTPEVPLRTVPDKVETTLSPAQGSEPPPPDPDPTPPDPATGATGV